MSFRYIVYFLLGVLIGIAMGVTVGEVLAGGYCEIGGVCIGDPPSLPYRIYLPLGVLS